MAISDYRKLGEQHQIPVWDNGSSHYEVFPNGDVISHDHFPCAKSGTDFMKPMYNTRKHGSIGKNGYKSLLQKFKTEKVTRFDLIPYQDGWEGHRKFKAK